MVRRAVVMLPAPSVVTMRSTCRPGDNLRALILSVNRVLFLVLMRLASRVTRVLLTPDASLACTRIERLLDTHALRTPATVTVGLVESALTGAGACGAGA